MPRAVAVWVAIVIVAVSALLVAYGARGDEPWPAYIETQK